MDETEHRRWLSELAAADRVARAQAEPELARQEARLARERAKLARMQASLVELEAAIEIERRAAEEDDGGVA